MDPNRLFAEAASDKFGRSTGDARVRNTNSGQGRRRSGRQRISKNGEMRRSANPIHRYQDGTSYRHACGRDFIRNQVESLDDLRWSLAVVDLRTERISCQEFLRRVVRECRIRNYRPNTIKAYRSAINSFLHWTGRLPHEIDRELVREYLDFLVEFRRGRSVLAWHLAAIRTVYDKFCKLDVTLGLCTPRKEKRDPVVLSREEVRRLLDAAVCRRDKLLFGLMYATGMRVSEVVRVQWRDIDLDRNLVYIRDGKGGVDRQVRLPESYRGLFAEHRAARDGEEYLFPSQGNRRGAGNSTRHLSPRTVQRAMASTLRLAGIAKAATPHSLRHSFATHTFEDGFDIRNIQKLLGHARLETTTIYVRVAEDGDQHSVPSPLDRLDHEQKSSTLGSFRAHAKRFEGEGHARVTLECATGSGPVYLTGIRASECRPGLWTIEFPAEEAWREQVERLSRDQRSAMRDAEFFESLRARILIALKGVRVPDSRIPPKYNQGFSQRF